MVLPPFSSDDVDALTNTAELPVLFSLNCLSGQISPFTKPGMDVKAVIKATGGAIGSMAPSVVTWGEMRDTYPAILSAMYGNASGASMSQGWVVALARLTTILAGVNASNNGVVDNARAWNFLGDPSLPFWANGTPKRFAGDEYAFTALGTKVRVVASSPAATGAEITIVNGPGQALARKVLPGPGTYELQLDGWAAADALEAVAAKPGFVSVSRGVG